MMNYELTDNVAVITIDDGKANAVGNNFLDEINALLDKAEAENAGAVILRGRDGLFSAGFDLGEFKKGPEAGFAMVGRGMELLIRLYSYPLPLVVACSGHGIAMGAFIIMACDYRIGTDGEYKITLPETAISMDIPLPMVSLTQARLSPRYLTRAAVHAEVFTPAIAVEAGFLDESVAAVDLDARVLEVATRLAQLPQKNYAANKLSLRRHTLEEMRVELDATLELMP